MYVCKYICKYCEWYQIFARLVKLDIYMYKMTKKNFFCIQNKYVQKYMSILDFLESLYHIPYIIYKI